MTPLVYTVQKSDGSRIKQVDYYKPHRMVTLLTAAVLDRILS